METENPVTDKDHHKIDISFWYHPSQDHSLGGGRKHGAKAVYQDIRGDRDDLR